MAPVWSKQPFKAIFITFHVIRTLVAVPWLLIRYTPKSARPSHECSMKQCVINALVRQLMVYHTETRSNSMSAVLSDHAKAGKRHDLAKPARSDLYSSILASDAAKPAEMLADVGREKLVLHFPGGAFVLAYGSEMYGRPVAAAMSKYVKADRTLFAQYRPSADDATRFPAALQDIVTFYHHVLSLGYRPENIILSGDSAAGNLIVAFLRHLEGTTDLPLPNSAILWSPWVHVTSSAGSDYKGWTNSANDCLTPELLQWGAEAYFPKHPPTTEEVAYVSPLHHPFRTRVPLFVQAGTTEAMFDTIQDFAQEMAGVEGNRLRFHATDFVTHNLIMAYEGVGLEKMVESAFEDYKHFLEAIEISRA
ncbi:Alpha/Beta hydrolase protein [Astrocystis sublimbata]|nr:Alpha/Beta hydrolase protein [Astrocystis sublimbata]